MSELTKLFITNLICRQIANLLDEKGDPAEGHEFYCGLLVAFDVESGRVDRNQATKEAHERCGNNPEILQSVLNSIDLYFDVAVDIMNRFEMVADGTPEDADVENTEG